MTPVTARLVAFRKVYFTPGLYSVPRQIANLSSTTGRANARLNISISGSFQNFDYACVPCHLSFNFNNSSCLSFRFTTSQRSLLSPPFPP